jgi:hypothetical protein
MSAVCCRDSIVAVSFPWSRLFVKARVFPKAGVGEGRKEKVLQSCTIAVLVFELHLPLFHARHVDLAASIGYI